MVIVSTHLLYEQVNPLMVKHTQTVRQQQQPFCEFDV